MSKPKGIFTSKYSQYKYGAGQSVDEFIVQNIAELTQLYDKGFNDGWTVYVRSLRASFKLTFASARSEDNISVVRARSGRGQWLRDLSTIDFVWKNQTTWFIDPVNGSDEATGIDQTNALKTCMEWFRRTGGVIDNITMTVTIMSNVSAPDSFPSRIIAQNGGNLRVAGLKTVVETGQLLSYTAPDYGNNTLGQIAKASGDWVEQEGRLIYITEKNAWARIVKDLGNGLASVTKFVATTNENSAFANVRSGQTPQAGNTYTVYTLPLLPMINGLEVFGDQRRPSLINEGFIVFKDLRLTIEAENGNWGYLKINNHSQFYVIFTKVDFPYCQLHGSLYLMFCHSGYNSESQYMWCFGDTTGTLALMYHLHTKGFLSLISVPYSSFISLRDVVVDSGYVSVSGGGASVSEGLGVFNSSNPVRISRDSKLTIYGKFYGSGNTGICVQIEGSLITPSTFSDITITNVAGTDQLRVGGSVNLLPDITASAGAVLPAVAPCTTWAQLGASPFSGKAFNYGNGAYIGPASL